MGKKSRKGQHHHAAHQHHKAGEGTNKHHQLHSGAWYTSHHQQQDTTTSSSRIFGSDDDDDRGESMTSNSMATEPIADLKTSYDHRRLMLSSDIELSTLNEQQQENALQQILDNLGNLLDSADAELERFEEEDDGLLKSAIVRSCGDLAWIVGELAQQLESQTEEERQSLAQAFLADAPASSSSFENQNSPVDEMATMKEGDFMDALQAAAGFLRDVEASLRNIDEDAAEELADAGLTVARLFIVSLQSIHSTITPQDILKQTQPRGNELRMDIEFLDEDDRKQQTTESNIPTELPETSQQRGGVKSSRRRKRSDRLRVLWPPLGPQVSKCLEWLKVEAAKRPVLSVALGCVLWPTAVITAFVGVPAVIADGFLQDFYKNFEDAPPIVGLERGAAHLYHTARLAILSGKLVSRQSLFVAKRQIERHGGMEKIAHNLLGVAIDRVTHPVESFQMACDGIGWTVDQIRRTLEDLHDEERSEMVQDLQVSNKPQRGVPEGKGGSGLSKFPILFLLCLLCIQHGRAEWVDPDTPTEDFTTAALSNGDDREFQLVFSDEFEVDGRTFHDGFDPRWTAINKNDYTNAALHFYSEENAETREGMLRITTERKTNLYKAFDEKKKRFYADKKHVQSAMLQGWNKFCFVGGIVEFRARLPGKAGVGGLWPALWMLGNLARATYVGSSDYMWPFSYSQCDEERRLSQEISACTKVNHYGLHSFQGRGAPEIDVIESMQGDSEELPSTTIRRPYQSASYQVAPGFDYHRPELGSRPSKGHWYQNLEYGNETDVDLNPFFYGVTLEHELEGYSYQADALSANMQLNDTHYDDHHTYRVEWEPPNSNGTGGYIRWYTDNDFVFGVTGDALTVMQTEIPSEPMYLIMNTAVSSHWGFPAPCPSGCSCECFECGKRQCECGLPDGYCENFPASFDIDYVRVYQAVDDPSHLLGCSPPQRPTDLFIQGHAERYMEDDQRRPLEPIIQGGGSCKGSGMCGGKSRGICNAKGLCVCEKDATGPHCLAHFGFDDETIPHSKAGKHHLHATPMVLPLSLIALLGVIVASLVIILLYVARQNRKNGYYQKVGPAVTPNQQTRENYYSVLKPAQTGMSPPVASYALPPKQSTVTYCVIDERMVDGPLHQPEGYSHPPYTSNGSLNSNGGASYTANLAPPARPGESYSPLKH